MARTITFVRHGQTDKVKPDSARRLTDVGKAQAARRREALGSPRFDLGIQSPMFRTRETLDIIAGTPSLLVKEVKELIHDSSTDDGKLLDAAFAKLGYASLKDYFEKSSPETVAALERYGSTAWQAIMDAIEDTNDGDSILVVGHAVLIPLTVYMGIGDTAMPEMMKINLGECEAITIDASSDGKVIGAYTTRDLA